MTEPPAHATPGPDRAGSARVAALDGVRALAVLAVLADHLWPGRPLGAAFPLGLIGVKVFFVLSGYLISGILLRGAERADRGERTRRGLLANFYARRFLRIFPIYYLTLAAAAALDLGEVRASLGWHAAYASNFYVALSAGNWPPFTGHFWSLALEEQFYLVWPWLLVFTPAPRRRAAVIAVILLTVAARVVAAAAGMGSHALSVLPIGSLDALALGALLASLDPGGEAATTAAAWRRRLDRASLAVAAPLLVALLLAQRSGMAEDARRVLWPLAVACVATSLVGWAAAPGAGGARRLLGWAPVARLGQISYGVYLYHPFVTHGVLRLVGATSVASVWVSLLCLAGSLAAAEASWRLIEAPLGRVKGRFAY